MDPVFLLKIHVPNLDFGVRDGEIIHPDGILQVGIGKSGQVVKNGGSSLGLAQLKQSQPLVKDLIRLLVVIKPGDGGLEISRSRFFQALGSFGSLSCLAISYPKPVIRIVFLGPLSSPSPRLGG